MPSPVLDTFLGYKPDVENPPPNSAKSCKNVAIHRHRQAAQKSGWIEQAQGYAKKFSALPGNDTLRKITAFTPDKISNLYVSDHGGRNVTILSATYTKTGYATGAPTVARSGIWIRPYWDGAAWIDAWLELTEMFIFEICELGTGGGNRRLYIDDNINTYGFLGKDPTGIVFNATHFKNWTIVYDGFADTQNYDLVSGCGYALANQFYLELVPGHLNTDFSNMTVGRKLLVYRCFLTSEMPSALTSHIYGLLSDARITTGNSSSDHLLAIGSRSFSRINASFGGSREFTETFDAMMADPGCPNVWPYAAMVGISGTDATPPGYTDLPPATYYLKYSIVFDDGNGNVNESELYDAETTNPGMAWNTLNVGNSQPVVAGYILMIYIYRSLGALPKRARWLRIYMSDDDIAYYAVRDVDFNDATAWDEAGVCTISGGLVKHWYAGNKNGTLNTVKFIDGADWANAGSQAEANRGGMLMTDSGVVQFTSAAVVARTTYAIGVRASGKLLPNTAFATPAAGSGAAMYDTFGQIASRMLLLEYNDGDVLMGLAPLRDRIVMLKSSTAVLVWSGSDGFHQEVISQADGCCSAEAIAVFDQQAYYPGYYGVYRYGTTGWQLINPDWNEEWKAVALATKRAAVAVIDPVNRQYRLAYGTTERIMDLDTGEWTVGALTDQPADFARDTYDKSVDFLSGALIQTLGAGTLHDGAAFDASYETNEFEVSPEPRQNALLSSIAFTYNSSVALSVQIYLDGVAYGSPLTLDASAVDVDPVIGPQLSLRCKRFRFKISCTFTSAAQTLQLKRIKAVYSLIPAGVSHPT